MPLVRETNLSEMLRQVGIDNCLFETDFPHPTGLFPIDNLEERLSALAAEERKRVLSTDAAKLYNVPVQLLANVAAAGCAVGTVYQQLQGFQLAGNRASIPVTLAFIACEDQAGIFKLPVFERV